MKWSDELLKSLGIMQTEIVFVNPKKVMVRFKDEDDRKLDNVTSIYMQDGPIAPQIHIYNKIQHGDENGEGRLGAPLKEIDSIIILD